jgi:hypothetical protein
MKFTIQLRDARIFDELESVKFQNEQDVFPFMDQWLDDREFVCIEFDTDANTARLLKNGERASA